ncbi:MAG TPA: D-alanine--D-alanine ligase [bacterium]|jgi:D-alanine-D-alanine ligase
MKILVLCGGESAERVVSLASGDAVARWLVDAGFDVLKYDPEEPGVTRKADEKMAPAAIGIAAPLPVSHGQYDPATVRGLLQVMDTFRPDLVFPILHGGRGEDGTLQSLLDWVGIPYAGPGALACCLAMNKHHSRIVMRAAGVPVTEGFVVPVERMRDPQWVMEQIGTSFGYPAVIKPLNGGSTIGLTKVQSADDVPMALAAVTVLEAQALVEAHFTGRELAATVVTEEAYPLVEIKPKTGFYDYSNKYTSGRTEYVCPAELSEEDTKRIQNAAVDVFRALGSSGFARIDFLLGADGNFVCLELNSLPGMTANSLVPKAARARGEEPVQLMRKIVECAVKRAEKPNPLDNGRRC